MLLQSDLLSHTVNKLARFFASFVAPWRTRLKNQIKKYKYDDKLAIENPALPKKTFFMFLWNHHPGARVYQRFVGNITHQRKASLKFRKK